MGDPIRSELPTVGEVDLPLWSKAANLYDFCVVQSRYHGDLKGDFVPNYLSRDIDADRANRNCTTEYLSAGLIGPLRSHLIAFGSLKDHSEVRTQNRIKIPGFIESHVVTPNLKAVHQIRINEGSEEVFTSKVMQNTIALHLES